MNKVILNLNQQLTLDCSVMGAKLVALDFHLSMQSDEHLSRLFISRVRHKTHAF